MLAVGRTCTRRPGPEQKVLFCWGVDYELSRSGGTTEQV